ncbi:hypothetical protein ABH920_009877 [Catenulispora sp. EB89]|uniref:AlbA family DNA-binding domain-containing protein n=1 Tax=Catenulispora sp. EB89 TaxID=3156257 RepID=UPI003512B030
MSSTRRLVPTEHASLTAAVADGLLPTERAWIDFKREFYPSTWPTDAQAKAQLRAKKHRDLATDMAAMAVSGGFLVVGVEEHKKAKTFTPYPATLYPGMREAIDALARDLIDPPVYVEITEAEDPANLGYGFLIIEVLESPVAPHRVDGVYWGRSDTGNIRLSDDEVERLMVARGRSTERIVAALQTTVKCDPIAELARGTAHLYFTAISTRGWPDMFARYAKDNQAGIDLAQRCREVAATVHAAGHIPAGVDYTVIYQNTTNCRRSAKTGGMWLTSWNGQPREGIDHMVGVDDDGAIRMIELSAGSLDNGLSGLMQLAQSTGAPGFPPGNGRVLYQELIRLRVIDMLHLVAVLSQDVGYVGTWMIGVRVDQLKDHVAGDQRGRFPAAAPAAFDDEVYQATTTVSRGQLAAAPTVAAEILRRLYRGLGVERQLDSTN